MFKNKKAFTLIETIIVVAILGILMMGTIIYLEGSDDKRKVIEAQGCAATIGGWINNYIYYALTSKSLRLDSNTVVSPDFYYIKLNGGNSNNGKCTTHNGTGTLCDSIEFLYSTGDNTNKPSYNTYSFSDTCNLSPSTKLKMYRNHNINSAPIIRINKGFTPVNLNDSNIFYINMGSSNLLTGEIMIVLCVDNDCKIQKQFAKRGIDGRTQTISLKNCAFYNDDKYTCKTRDDCTVYNSSDPTKCDKY